jgi:hypothetical protein
MKLSASLLAIVTASAMLARDCRAWSSDDDQETSHQLSLADLAGYRAALSGKPDDRASATDPPSLVKFKDLWNRPDVFRGRRVTVQGRVVRTFRQGPVGTFPPLAEVWITSPAGDPFCAVFPQPDKLDREQTGAAEPTNAAAEKSTRDDRTNGMPGPGRTVRFTGTFLKMVRYAGADTARLAPLIVGDQLPVPISAEPTESQVDRMILDSTRGSSPLIQLAIWALGLTVAALVAVTFARWHLRAPVRSAPRRATSASLTLDPPLEFVEPPNEP